MLGWRQKCSVGGTVGSSSERKVVGLLTTSGWSKVVKNQPFSLCLSQTTLLVLQNHSTAPWELPFDVAVTSDCDNRRWQLEPGKRVTVSLNRSLSWELARTTWQMLSLSYHWTQNNVRNPALAKMIVMSAKGYNHNPLPTEEKYVGQVTEEHPVAEVITGASLTWETLQFSSRLIINEYNLNVIWVGFSFCLIQWVWDCGKIFSVVGLIRKNLL